VRTARCFHPQHAPLTRRLLERAALAGGERALEVGCGFGDLTIELARRVGPSGFAAGIDLSFAMLETAMDSARTAGLRNIRFENLDAQTHPFIEREFDLIVSQFGVMFFADPVAAFANVRSALRPEGQSCSCAGSRASATRASRFHWTQSQNSLSFLRPGHPRRPVSLALPILTAFVRFSTPQASPTSRSKTYTRNCP